MSDPTTTAAVAAPPKNTLVYLTPRELSNGYRELVMGEKIQVGDLGLTGGNTGETVDDYRLELVKIAADTQSVEGESLVGVEWLPSYSPVFRPLDSNRRFTKDQVLVEVKKLLAFYKKANNMAATPGALDEMIEEVEKLGLPPNQ